LARRPIGASGKGEVFIDLGEFPVTEPLPGSRLKVLRPADPVQMRSVRDYLRERIPVIVDMSDYAGDRNVAFSMVRDMVLDCGGDVWNVNLSTLLATPFGVSVDNRE
jgi:hypothetical protein